MDARLEPVAFERIEGFAADDHAEAFAVFLRLGGKNCRGLRRPAPREAAVAGARRASPATRSRPTSRAPRRARVSSSAVSRLSGCAGRARRGFLTGYYEPVVEASLTPTPEFACADSRAAPPISSPSPPSEAPPAFGPGVAGAQRRLDGALAPIPSAPRSRRAAPASRSSGCAIAVEAVPRRRCRGRRGSIFADGRVARLAYDGRNGQPYTSIGRLLIEAGEIPKREMSLSASKAWLRAAGLGAGRRRPRSDAAQSLLRLFQARDCRSTRPTGRSAAPGVALTPLRSIAVDRDDAGPMGRRSGSTPSLPWARSRSAPVPPADDRAGHRIGDFGAGARRSLLRWRRCGGRARRRDPPRRRFHRAVAGGEPR